MDRESTPCGVCTHPLSDHPEVLGVRRCEACHCRMFTLAHQVAPEDYLAGEAKGWVLLMGRGSGKTKGGAIEVHRRMMETPQKIRIITPTSGDAIRAPKEALEEVALAHSVELTWRPNAPGGATLVWPNGSVAMIIGTPTPRDVDRLRASGNVSGDWFDEACFNPMIYEAWRQSLLSRRIGKTWWLATTSPQPMKLVKNWMERDNVRVSRATMMDNPLLAEDVISEMMADIPEGSREWREEVLGELVEDFPGALWSREKIDGTRLVDHPPLDRVCVGVDPATGPGTTGIVVVGVAHNELYVLEDHSMRGLPAEWSAVVAEVAERWECPIVAEQNQGYETVRTVLEWAAGIPVKMVNAQQGKRVRAEPVSLLWSSGRGHIVGSLPHLEDEMTSYVPGKSESPDRMDAMVHAAADLGVTRKRATYRSPLDWARRVA